MTKDQFLLRSSVLSSWMKDFFSSASHLHTARFAHRHELTGLFSATLDEPSLLLAEGPFHHVLRVNPTAQRQELGNVLAVAPTRGGKGLLADSQLLTWPHSVIVNDIKGELYTATAGYRATLGNVYVLDPDGVGHRYDPLVGKTNEKDLITIATNLLYKANEDDPIFTQRAITMLTQLFLAARIEGHSPLPYVRKIVRLGLRKAAMHLHTVSPDLATQFLDVEFSHADFTDKFLLSCWGTLAAPMRLLLTDTTVRCFAGWDFTARDIITSPAPVTVYLRWPERDLLAFSPLVRLIWKSLIDEMMDTYDRLGGVGCRPVLLLVDEAGRTAIPSLSEHATTVNGRGISMMIAVQSLSQLDALYGKYKADTLRNNMDSQIFYRQASQETADYLQRCLGNRSGFAHSTTEHGGEQTSQGQVEQAVALMTAQAIKQLGDTDIIGFHRNLPPFRAHRMDWRRFPLLVKRQRFPPPPLPLLPPLAEGLSETASASTAPRSSWRHDPALLRWGSHLSATYGGDNGA